ncbi:MAG: TonB-dependent receptor [Pseudomonadota bacterium]
MTKFSDRRFRLAFCGVIFTQCVALSAFASSTDLDVLVVTASRSPSDPSTAPVRTTVITRAEIVARGATDLAEAVAYVPGLQLYDLHGKPGKGVRLQGMESEHILIMIDGRPVAPSTGSSVDLRQIGTANIVQIEILKGPASALYGSQAMGGVINVITTQAEADSGGSITVGVGTWGDRDLSGNVGSVITGADYKWVTPNAIYRVDGSRHSSNGYDLDTNTYATEGAVGTRDNVSGRAEWFVSDSASLSVDAALYVEDLSYRFATAAPGTPTGEIPKQKLEDTTRSDVALSFEQEADIGDLEFALSAERFASDASQDAIGTPQRDQWREQRLDTNRFDAQLSRELDNGQLLTLGMLAARAELTQNQFRDNGTAVTETDELPTGIRQENRDLFAQLQGGSDAAARWQFGLRYQHDEDFGGHTAGKFSWRKPFSDSTALRLSLAEGYRIPSLKERFFLFDHSFNGYRVIGNPDLQPEINRNVQVEIEHSNAAGTWTASVFNHDLTDLIDTAENGSTIPGVVDFQYLNIARARITGVELQWHRTFADSLALGVGVEWLDTEDKSTGLELSQRPPYRWLSCLRLGRLPVWGSRTSWWLEGRGYVPRGDGGRPRRPARQLPL